MVRSPLFLLERDLSVPGSQTDLVAVPKGAETQAAPSDIAKGDCPR